MAADPRNSSPLIYSNKATFEQKHLEREMAKLSPGGRKGTFSGTCGVCAEGGGCVGNYKVPEKVLEGLEAVRKSGTVDMLCRTDLIVKAHYLGYLATRDLVASPENFASYTRGIFEGVEVEGR